MSNDHKQCPVCKLENQKVLANRDYGDKVTFDCLRCGRYTIFRTAMVTAKKQENFTSLSGWLRERNLLTVEIPMLTTYFMDELLSTLPTYSPRQKQIKLLKAIEILTDYPGREVILEPDHDISLAWAKNENNSRTISDH